MPDFTIRAKVTTRRRVMRREGVRRKICEIKSGVKGFAGSK